jgi:transcriptional regulator with XRE-family HTH domain
MTSSRARLGRALKSIRAAADMTLADVSAKTGLAISTLSKVENGLMSLTYDKLLQLSEGLQVDFTTLLGGDDSGEPGPVASGIAANRIARAEPRRPDAPVVTARRSLSRKDDGLHVLTSNYDTSYLCTDLSHRAMVPMVSKILARTLEEFGEPYAHAGEELIYVLHGAVTLWSEFYEPVRLEAGDSVYFDSTMRHAVLSSGPIEAEILNICFMPGAGQARTLRELAADTSHEPIPDGGAPRSRRPRRTDEG